MMSIKVVLALIVATQFALVSSAVPHHTELFALWKKDFDAKWLAEGLPSEGLAVKTEWESHHQAKQAWGLVPVDNQAHQARGTGLLRKGNEISLLSTRETSKFGFFTQIYQALDKNSKCNKAKRYKKKLTEATEFIENELKDNKLDIMKTKCEDQMRRRIKDCKCSQKLCETIQDDTCVNDLEQLGKYYEMRLVHLRQVSRKNNYALGGSECKLMDALDKLGELIADAINSLVKFLLSIVCMAIDIALDVFGAIIDSLIVVVFPPIATLKTTPMCLMKLSSKGGMKAMKKSSKTFAKAAKKIEKLHDKTAAKIKRIKKKSGIQSIENAAKKYVDSVDQVQKVSDKASGNLNAVDQTFKDAQTGVERTQKISAQFAGFARGTAPTHHTSCYGTWDCDYLGDTSACKSGYTCCSAPNSDCTDGSCWHSNSALGSAGNCNAPEYALQTRDYTGVDEFDKPIVEVDSIVEKSEQLNANLDSVIERLDEGRALIEDAQEKVDAVNEKLDLAKSYGTAIVDVTSMMSIETIYKLLWDIFTKLCEKSGLEPLQKIAAIKDDGLISFIIDMMWDAMCGSFGSAFMTLVGQLVFCNVEMCQADFCTVNAFKFGSSKPKPEEAIAGLKAGTNWDAELKEKPMQCLTTPVEITHHFRDLIKCQNSNTVYDHKYDRDGWFSKLKKESIVTNENGKKIDEFTDVMLSKRLRGSTMGTEGIEGREWHKDVGIGNKHTPQCKINTDESR